MKLNIFVLLRIAIGVLLCLSGFEKATQPYQNFLYVIQGYEVFPSIIEKAIAIVMPWAELLVGIFMIAGLWLNVSIRAAIVFFVGFILIISQALIRQIPLDNCGCFGEALHIDPHVMLVFDSVTLIVLCLMIRRFTQTQQLSLDHHFAK